MVDDVLAERDELGGSFAYAGVGVGSDVGALLGGRVSRLVELGDLDPAESPKDVARIVRRQLLGDEARDDRDAAGRLASTLSAEVASARAEGLTAEEIRAVWQGVEAELGD